MALHVLRALNKIDVNSVYCLAFNKYTLIVYWLLRPKCAAWDKVAVKSAVTSSFGKTRSDYQSNIHTQVKNGILGLF